MEIIPASTSLKRARHTNHFMKMQSKEKLIKQKTAGLQKLLYDDVMKRRAMALESGCAIKPYQPSCENDCGTYKRKRKESNSFEPWEAVAVQFRAGRRIGG